jgi:general secretion pathway protein L
MMKFVGDIEAALAAWTAAAAQALDALAGRMHRRRQVRIVRDGADLLTFSQLRQPNNRPHLRDATLRLADGRPEHALPADWLAALQGSIIECHLAPEQVMFRQLDFPKQAATFLDGMIRSQIDRLTPWAADDALFGFSPPREAPNERLELTLAATSRATVVPLVQLADRVGAAALTVSVGVDGDGAAMPQPISVFAVGLRSAIAGGRDLAKLLRHLLLGFAGAAALALVAGMVIGNVLDGELQDVQARISRQRAALRSNATAGGGSAETLLARRKQSTPSAVLVLDAISKILPDSTYVTDLHIEGDRLQVAGLTRDSPMLIRLIEQSPQFSRATFYAPTTREANEPGERFHIEAHINAYFGGGS